MTITPTFATPSGFLGITRSDRAADFTIAGIPLDLGTTNRAGTRDGPHAIRRASRMLTDGDHPEFWLEPAKLNLADIGDFHLALPSGASPAAVGLLRAGVASLEAAAAAFNAYAAATINTARRYGQIAHATWSPLRNVGETISPEVIGVDLWIDVDQMNAYYELGIGFEHFGPVFAGEPQLQTLAAK